MCWFEPALNEKPRRQMIERSVGAVAAGCKGSNAPMPFFRYKVGKIFGAFCQGMLGL